MLVYNPKIEGYFYTPQSQKEKNIKKPFRVKLKVLDVEEIAKLQDMLITRTQTEVKNNYGMYCVEVCFKGISDWENIEDTDGNQVLMIKTPSGLISKESLNKIPYQMIEEIATVIMSVSEKPENLKVFADK